MTSGPLPDPDSIRRNKPTIPTTKLPAGGFVGETPGCPYSLMRSGREFWDWAWTLPQAAAWDDGTVYAVARRAQLEDDLAALERTDEFDLAELLGMEEETDALKRLASVIKRLKQLSGGALGVKKEMRELDKRLGLDAKALGELRWSIVEEDEDEDHGAQPSGGAKVRHLRAVDRSAAG